MRKSCIGRGVSLDGDCSSLVYYHRISGCSFFGSFSSVLVLFSMHIEGLEHVFEVSLVVANWSLCGRESPLLPLGATL